MLFRLAGAALEQPDDTVRRPSVRLEKARIRGPAPAGMAVDDNRGTEQA